MGGDRYPRGRPAKRRDQLAGRLTVKSLRDDLTYEEAKGIYEAATNPEGKTADQIKSDLTKLVEALDVGYRVELSRRTREILQLLKTDENFRRRKWVSLKPLRRRGRPVPVLDERELSDLAHESAKKEMIRSLARRESTFSRALGAQRRVSDSQLRIQLRHPKIRVARSIRAKAQLLLKNGVPLTLRQLQTRIALILRGSKSVK